MICYKDKTWCTYTECIKSKICKSFLTKEEELKADNWWKEFKSKDIAPIARYTTKPKCYEQN
jgi:hypothetical protein